MQQKHMDVRTTIKKLLITVLYDKKVPSDKLLAVKQAIIAVMKVTENQMVFTPTTLYRNRLAAGADAQMDHSALSGACGCCFFSGGRLASFFRRLNAALEDKTQKIEQTTNLKEESEQETAAEEEGEAEAAAAAAKAKEKARSGKDGGGKEGGGGSDEEV